MTWSSAPEFGFQDGMGQAAPVEFAFQGQDGGKRFNEAATQSAEIALQEATPGAYPSGPGPGYMPYGYAGMGAAPPMIQYDAGLFGRFGRGLLIGAALMGAYVWWSNR